MTVLLHRLMTPIAAITLTLAAGIAPVQAQSSGKTVAVVNGETITETELREFFAELPQEVQASGMEQLYPLLLEEIIGRRVIADKARVAGALQEPELQKRLAQIENELLYNYYVVKQAEKQVDDAAVRNRYDQMVSQMPEGEEVDVSHILLETEEEAKEVIKLVTEGTPFADLARERSKDPGSAANGGSYGWVEKGKFVPEFEEAAFALEPNTFTSEPVQSQFGWHVILVADRRPIQPPAFEEVSDRLREQMAQGNIRGVIQDAIAGATVERFDLNGNPIAAPAQ